jgi:1,4-alpha-glucan branching enzyme
MLSKMPGDYWQKFANLRALYGYMYAHPGKKLLFMGAEIGQWTEWNDKWQLDWMLLDHSSHQALQEYVKALNRLYAAQPALHQVDFNWEGFEWMWITASSPLFAARGIPMTSLSWLLILRQCRAGAIAWACRDRGSTASC